MQRSVNLVNVALRNSKKAQPGNYKDHPGSEQNCLGDDQPRRFPAGLFWRDRRRELALDPRQRCDVLAAITASYGLPRLNLLGFAGVERHKIIALVFGLLICGVLYAKNAQM